MRRPASKSAEIVDMSVYVHVSRSRSRLVRNELPRDATLLSMRQHLGLQASIEIDDLAGIQTHYSISVRDDVVSEVRKLLNLEFGSLRVYRHRRMFMIRHHCAEGLIAGLLRIQYHARQITLPSVNFFGEESDKPGISLSWGVGHSALEAERERLRRRRHKRFPAR